MKQHLNIKKFYGHSEQNVHNQVFISMIVYCLNILAQLGTNSSRTYLQNSRWLKPAHIWIQKIAGKAVTFLSPTTGIHFFICYHTKRIFTLHTKVNPYFRQFSPAILKIVQRSLSLLQHLL